MGPYCKFCDHRCFVVRQIPGRENDPTAPTILATCPDGMALDRERTGYDHRTAINPLADRAPAAGTTAARPDQQNRATPEREGAGQ